MAQSFFFFGSVSRDLFRHRCAFVSLVDIPISFAFALAQGSQRFVAGEVTGTWTAILSILLHSCVWRYKNVSIT